MTGRTATAGAAPAAKNGSSCSLGTALRPELGKEYPGPYEEEGTEKALEGVVTGA